MSYPTIKQVLADVALRGKVWRCTWQGIRTTANDWWDCPLVVWLKDRGVPGAEICFAVTDAAPLLGLKRSRLIAAAADDDDAGKHDKRVRIVRAAMIQALKPTEAM